MAMKQIYECIGEGYAALRRPDPRIASQINLSLGSGIDVTDTYWNRTNLIWAIV
jgi:hypothetical protein